MAGKLSADDLETLVREVQLLKDKAEIRETLNRYWFGVDRREPAVVASAFAPDGHYGNLDRDELEHLMAWALPEYECLQHCFASSEIQVDGDTATADTMAIGFGLGDNADGERTVFARGLRYVDKLVRTDDGWKITERAGHDDRNVGHDTFWQFEGLATEIWHPGASQSASLPNPKFSAHASRT
jgi:hypothetical protein